MAALPLDHPLGVFMLQANLSLCDNQVTPCNRPHTRLTSADILYHFIKIGDHA